jgi:HAD superfamily hydrolase (TIGR01549 family)
MAVGVGFDFDHTLGLDNGLERRAYVRLAEELGVPIALQNHANAALVDGLLAQFRADQLSLEGAVDAFVAALGVARATGRAAHGKRYRDICYQLVDELVRPLDGAPELLAELADAGVRTAILTNGWSPLQQLKIKRAVGNFPGAILVSDQIGTLKPSADAFKSLADTLGCAHADVWYVGDNPVIDIAGAHAAGMRSVWLDWEGQGYPAELPPPGARIHRLLDLLPVVRGS